LAEMPEERREMTDNEVGLAYAKLIARGIVTAVLSVVVGGASCNAYSAWTTLETARVQSTATAKEATQARAIAAKADADRAMFESMRK
jgi:hypothetical protein